MSTSSNEEEIRALADAKADQKIGKQEFLNQIFGEVGTFIKGTMTFEALCMIMVTFGFCRLPLCPWRKDDSSWANIHHRPLYYVLFENIWSSEEGDGPFQSGE